MGGIGLGCSCRIVPGSREGAFEMHVSALSSDLGRVCVCFNFFFFFFGGGGGGNTLNPKPFRV